MFSGGIERGHWPEMVFLKFKFPVVKLIKAFKNKFKLIAYFCTNSNPNNSIKKIARKNAL